MKPVVDSTAYLLISHGSRDPRPQEAMNRLADLVRNHLENQLLQRQVSTSQQVSEGQSEGPSEGNAVVSQVSGAEAEAASGSRTALLARPTKVQSRTRATVQIAPPAEAIAHVMVGTACLELAPMPLSEQIYEFGTRVAAAGVKVLKLMPVFLMAGVHVKEDIPEEIEAAKALLSGVDLQLTLCPHLGSHEKMGDMLAGRLAAVPNEGALLVAHGSRRPRGNKMVKGLADQLDITVAYWAIPPDIETQVIDLMQQGVQRLTILPYFLFPGGITDAITHRTEELAERFPKVNFRMLPTLGATDEIADLAIELICQ